MWPFVLLDPTMEGLDVTPDEARKSPVPPEQVALYSSPWVQGTIVETYLGPATTVRDGWEDGEDPLVDLLDALRVKIAALGGNTGVGVEIAVDPFARTATAVGTACRMRPL